MVNEILFVAVALACFVFALRKIEWALAVFPVFVPFYQVRAVYAGVPFTLPETVIYALFAASAVMFVRDNLMPVSIFSSLFGAMKGVYFRRKSFFRRYAFLILAVGLFIAGVLIGFTVVQDKIVFADGHVFEGMKTALGIFKGWILAPLLLLAVYLSRIKNNIKLLDTLNFYLLTAVALSVWALFQASTHGYVTPDARASGPFESANYLALYIVPALVYVMIRIKQIVLPYRGAEKISLISRIFKSGEMKEKHPEVSLFIIAFLLVFLALLASKSYAGMISALAGILLYSGVEYYEYRREFLDGPKPWKYLAAFFLVVAVIAAAVYVSDPAKWRAMFRFDERNSSSVRLEVYSVSAGLISENWLTGIGVGQYEAMYKMHAERILGREPYELNMLHPHNLFLAVWLNTGLLGLAGFLVVLWAAFSKSLTGMRKFPSMKINNASKLRVAGAAMLTSIVVFGFFDTPFFKNDLSIIFWIIIAVIFAANHEDEEGI